MMPLPKFKIQRPQSLACALSLLQSSPDAVVLAGGTDLLVSMKQGLYTPERVVDLKRVPELSALEVGEDGVFIGAAVKLSVVRDHPVLKELYPVLCEAAGVVASPNIQNMGTIGGNLCLDTRCWYFNQSEFWRQSKGYCLKKDGTICQAAPGAKRCFAVFSSDTAPALIALRARVELARWDGDGQVMVKREIPLEELYREEGIHRLALKKGEILVGVRLPAPEGGRSGYLKYRKRQAIDYPLASVAVSLTLERGVIKGVRIVLGALASAPVVASEAMELLEGAGPTPELIDRAVELVGRRTCPVKNQAGTPAHRKEMARVYCKRLLARLAL